MVMNKNTSKIKVISFLHHFNLYHFKLDVSARLSFDCVNALALETRQVPSKLQLSNLFTSIIIVV